MADRTAQLKVYYPEGKVCIYKGFTYNVRGSTESHILLSSEGDVEVFHVDKDVPVDIVIREFSRYMKDHLELGPIDWAVFFDMANNKRITFEVPQDIIG